MEGKFKLTPAFAIYEVNYPSAMDSPYAGGHGFDFHFNDGRVFEIVINHFPRKLTIKRWCSVTLDEFLAMMTAVFNSLI